MENKFFFISCSRLNFCSLRLHQNTDKNQSNKKIDDIIECSSKERELID